MTKDLSKYLYLCDAEKIDMRNVLDWEKILKYAERLRELNIGPSGQVNKIQTISLAVDYLLSRLSLQNPTAEDREASHLARVISTKIKQLKKGLTKEKMIQSSKKREFVAENLCSPSEVMDFLNSETVISAVTETDNEILLRQ